MREVTRHAGAAPAPENAERVGRVVLPDRVQALVHDAEADLGRHPGVGVIARDDAVSRLFPGGVDLLVRCDDDLELLLRVRDIQRRVVRGAVALLDNSGIYPHVGLVLLQDAEPQDELVGLEPVYDGVKEPLALDRQQHPRAPQVGLGVNHGRLAGDVAVLVSSQRKSGPLLLWALLFDAEGIGVIDRVALLVLRPGLDRVAVGPLGLEGELRDPLVVCLSLIVGALLVVTALAVLLGLDDRDFDADGHGVVIVVARGDRDGHRVAHVVLPLVCRDRQPEAGGGDERRGGGRAGPQGQLAHGGLDTHRAIHRGIAGGHLQHELALFIEAALAPEVVLHPHRLRGAQAGGIADALRDGAPVRGKADLVLDLAAGHGAAEEVVGGDGNRNRCALKVVLLGDGHLRLELGFSIGLDLEALVEASSHLALAHRGHQLVGTQRWLGGELEVGGKAAPFIQVEVLAIDRVAAGLDLDLDGLDLIRHAVLAALDRADAAPEAHEVPGPIDRPVGVHECLIRVHAARRRGHHKGRVTAGGGHPANVALSGRRELHGAVPLRLLGRDATVAIVEVHPGTGDRLSRVGIHQPAQDDVRGALAEQGPVGRRQPGAVLHAAAGHRDDVDARLELRHLEVAALPGVLIYLLKLQGPLGRDRDAPHVEPLEAVGQAALLVLIGLIDCIRVRGKVFQGHSVRLEGRLLGVIQPGSDLSLLADRNDALIDLDVHVGRVSFAVRLLIGLGQDRPQGRGRHRYGHQQDNATRRSGLRSHHSTSDYRLTTSDSLPTLRAFLSVVCRLPWSVLSPHEAVRLP